MPGNVRSARTVCEAKLETRPDLGIAGQVVRWTGCIQLRKRVLNLLVELLRHGHLPFLQAEPEPDALREAAGCERS